MDLVTVLQVSYKTLVKVPRMEAVQHLYMTDTHVSGHLVLVAWSQLEKGKCLIR